MRLRSFLSHRTSWIIGLSLIWTGLLAFNIVPELRGGFGWRWRYDPMLDWHRLAPLILGVMVYVPGAVWLLRRRSVAGLLAWAVAGSLGLALAAAYVRGDVLDRLYTITISGQTGGWYLAATHINDLKATLQQWPQFMVDSTSFSTHMGISPPGTVVAYYAASSFFTRFPALANLLAAPVRWLQCQVGLGYTNAQYAAAWLGILMPVWSSLTLLPLYFLGRSVFGPAPARWSVVWWPLVPSFLIFTPLPNTFYALPALVMISLLLLGLRRNQAGWVVAAGGLMSLLSFLTFTFLPLLLFAGLLTLGMYGLKRITTPSDRLPWHWPVQMGVWFGLGLSTVWLLVYAASGLGPWEVWRAASQAHLDLDRPYWPWLILHLNDFFMFTGWPLALLAGVGLWPVLKKVRSPKAASESDVMVLAAALTVLLLDLSGALRGESGRILLFLSPWVLLTAARALSSDHRLGAAVTITQGLIAIVMIVCLRVLNSGFLAPGPAAPPVLAPLAEDLTALPSGALFGEAVRLNTFAGKIQMQPNAQASEQAVLDLWLNWDVVGSIDKSYYLAVLPVAPDGQVSPAATVQPPFQDRYPMLCWNPALGELHDQLEVPLFKSQSGDWWVSFSLIDVKTGQKLEVVTPDGARDQQIGLGPFH